jgi:hypothetical protein
MVLGSMLGQARGDSDSPERIHQALGVGGQGGQLVYPTGLALCLFVKTQAGIYPPDPNVSGCRAQSCPGDREGTTGV